VVTTGAIRRAKLQSNNQQQTNSHLLQVGCPSCRQTNSVRALKGNYSRRLPLALITELPVTSIH